MQFSVHNRVLRGTRLNRLLKTISNDKTGKILPPPMSCFNYTTDRKEAVKSKIEKLDYFSRPGRAVNSIEILADSFEMSPRSNQVHQFFLLTHF